MTTSMSKIRRLEEVPKNDRAVVELISPRPSEYPLAGLIKWHDGLRKVVLFMNDRGEYGRIIYRMPNGEDIGEVDLTSPGVNLGPGKFVFDYILNHFGFRNNTFDWVFADRDLKGAGL